MVVRCEVYAYRASAAEALAGELSSLSVGSSTTPSASSLVNIRRVGSAVAQSSLMELKTRWSTSKYSPFGDMYLRLLLGQVPTLCVGVHDGKGAFDAIDTIRLDSRRFDHAREKEKPALRRLRRLLEEIQQVVMKRGPGAQLSLVCRDSELVLMQRAADDVLLPPELLTRFTTT